jgi:predicted dithiol-disulfide oxidoreductase (DUF899 family)
MRARDALAAKRRRMPWMAVDKAYRFEGPAGGLSLLDLFFRTYFVSDRGDEQMGNTWNYLDITALGRQEEWEDSPQGYPQTPPYLWWNYHDRYGATPIGPQD